ncbi:hypothetical protein BC835DRAFT_883396 [Cytidiella melzeri]|nr:hypothetical protein BC835DRAFT_883396 [Cytidiella melzeri]
MSEKQNVVTLLAVIAETCSASKLALDQTHSQNASAPEFSVLRKDLLSILTLIYTLTTKVSLTLRASEAAHGASLAPLQDLIKYISSLTTCSTLFDPHGRTLAEDVRKGAQDVLENLKVFARAFTDIVEQGEASREDYLVKTGAVHDAIDHFRRNLPEDNAASVRSRWSKDREMLEDSLAEVGEMVESDGAGDVGDDSDDEVSDEWDELGLGSVKTMTPQELDRTKKVHPMLRMIVLLHKRVLVDILKAPFTPTSHSLLDKMPPQSHDLLLAMEDVVAALYALQDIPVMRTAIMNIAASVNRLKLILYQDSFIRSVDTKDKTLTDIDALTKKMERADIHGTPTQRKAADVRKWFDTCFEQILKLSQNIITSLDDESSSS